jgi:hypothetical protein
MGVVSSTDYYFFFFKYGVRGGKGRREERRME